MTTCDGVVLGRDRTGELGAGNMGGSNAGGIPRRQDGWRQWLDAPSGNGHTLRQRWRLGLVPAVWKRARAVRVLRRRRDRDSEEYWTSALQLTSRTRANRPASLEERAGALHDPRRRPRESRFVRAMVPRLQRGRRAAQARHNVTAIPQPQMTSFACRLMAWYLHQTVMGFAACNRQVSQCCPDQLPGYELDSGKISSIITVSDG